MMQKVDENHGTLRYSFGHARANRSDAIHGQPSIRSTELPARIRRTSLRLLPHLRVPAQRAPLQAHLPQLRLLPQLRGFLLSFGGEPASNVRRDEVLRSP